MAREGFIAYHSYLDSLEPLNDAERGRLFTALLQYSSGSEPEELRGNERFIFPAMRKQIDRDIEKYTAKCAQQRANVSKRWNTTVSDGKPTDTDDTKNKGKGKDKAKDKDKDKGTAETERNAPKPPEGASAGEAVGRFRNGHLCPDFQDQDEWRYIGELAKTTDEDNFPCFDEWILTHKRA